MIDIKPKKLSRWARLLRRIRLPNFRRRAKTDGALARP
jgi:hypothetical protein